MVPSLAQYLTTKEVAKWLRVSQQWVRDHASGRSQPLLPAYIISGARRPTYRFDPKEVTEWLKKLEKQ